MRVLVACECSGVVRDAFAARGHDAWSCDLLPSDGPHLQADARDVVTWGWDLVVAHPPCTYLAQSGVRWLHDLAREERWGFVADAADMFRAMLDANAPRVCVENPTPHKYARALIGRPTQYVQPHEFGTLEQKRTGLWLRGLPPLLVREDARAALARLSKSERMPTWAAGESKGRQARRSVTSPGLAAAMAEQWG